MPVSLPEFRRFAFLGFTQVGDGRGNLGRFAEGDRVFAWVGGGAETSADRAGVEQGHAQGGCLGFV